MGKYELQTRLHFTHDFRDENFPLRCRTPAQTDWKNDEYNQYHLHIQIVFIHNHLTFSVSSARPKRGDGVERNGAQNPPLVVRSHAAERVDWSALNVKLRGKLHQVVGLKLWVWAWVRAYFRLITPWLSVGSMKLEFPIISWRDIQGNKIFPLTRSVYWELQWKLIKTYFIIYSKLSYYPPSFCIFFCHIRRMT